MIRYKIEEICGDWAIYEVRETETEGGERCLLILNSRANAEYVKAILEHEARYPNSAVPYRPEVADMSDEEVVAIFRVCSSGMSDGCERCPLRDAEECFGKIDERILGMLAKYVELKKESVLAHHPKPYEKEIEELTCDMCDSCREAVTREDCPNHCCDGVSQHAEALYARGWHRLQWISVDERLPDDYNDYLVVVKHKYEYEDEWEYDVDVGGPALGDDGYIDHFWETYHDWEVGEECHITHWMPLPEPPKMKGGAE
jgi:hypothetical protein